MSEFVDLMKRTREHLMSGVSYMIPFVVAGGILLALSVLLSGQPAAPDSYILGGIFKIGAAGFTLLIPILAGFIAFSMADRPGIAPGAIGGLIASQVGAGFLGGLIAGLVAGIVVFYLKKIPVPTTVRSVMPIFVIPITGTLIVGGLMLFVIGSPIATVMTLFTDWLTAMSGGSKIFLGIILGIMIAFDMGGPINKVAFTFAVGLVGSGVYNVMGAVGVAIMVPPVGMGLATLVAPKKYTYEERENGRAALLMGTIGITEGAIPFAAMDPLRVIPSLMTGSAAGAVTAMLLGVGNHAPWGGWIVLPVVDNIIGYVIATLVGVVITAVMVNALKKQVVEKVEKVETEDDDFLAMEIEM
ncbi:PTS fructose transporter subunit EIIC [Neobacillus drentensis]|uniref:PTS fructose transporter subunit EIIC n=1 Tax=Neobacillus drentensis TaxID=220684 RepID=UPI003002FC7E